MFYYLKKKVTSCFQEIVVKIKTETTAESLLLNSLNLQHTTFIHFWITDDSKVLFVVAFDVEIKAKHQHISKSGAEASLLKIIFFLSKKRSLLERNECCIKTTSLWRLVEVLFSGDKNLAWIHSFVKQDHVSWSDLQTWKHSDKFSTGSTLPTAREFLGTYLELQRSINWC